MEYLSPNSYAVMETCQAGMSPLYYYQKLKVRVR
jgi:hypothetical protein